MSNYLAEISLPLDRLVWSQDDYGEKFSLSYRLISGGGRIVVGASEIARNLFSGRRWIHWEASAGVICLKEIWLDSELIDHAICLQIGDLSLGAPLSVHCETISYEMNEIVVRMSFAMNDGSLHNMTFRSTSHTGSIFADLVDYKAGGVVSSRCDHLPYLQTPDFALIRTHQISDSIRDGQAITCSTHLSHFGVVFGLNQGDIVYVRAASDGLYVETLLHSEWIFTSLLSGFLKPNRKAAILAVSGAHLKDYSILVSVSADGILRVWDCLSRTVLQEISVMSFIDPEIASDPSQGVVMEGVCLDTAPFDLLVSTGEVDPNALGLTIAIGVTVRVGRERSWNIALLSWSPLKSGLPVRSYLRPIVVPPTISSALISLEHIALSPAQILQSNCGCDLIATLWNMDGDVIPVSYSTNGFDWSNTGHITALSSSPIHLDPIMIPYNPAETRLAALTNDKFALESIAGNMKQDSMIWTATGTPHNTVDMNYLSSQITSTFLQRLFSPGRFLPIDVIEVLCHDTPYELQLNRNIFDQSTSQVMEGCLEILLDCVLRTCKAIEKELHRTKLDENETKREIPFNRNHLEIQIQVSLQFLSMCEDRKRKRISTPGSCTILKRTAGLSIASRKEERNYLRQIIPFHFINIRPSAIGIILKLEFFSLATVSGFLHTTSASSSSSSFASSSSAQVGSAMNEIFSKISDVLQTPEMLHFDSALTRFVSDVITIDTKSTSWILKAVKMLAPKSSRLSAEVLQIISKYHISFEAIHYLAQLLQYDLIWGTNSLGETDHSHHQHSLNGFYAALLFKEYSTLMIRERYSFIKTLLFSLSILLDHLDDHDRHENELLQACSRLMYDSFLLWTSGLYFSGTNIDERVDFKDVQYDSTIIRSLLNHRIANIPTGSWSVWGTYWTNLLSRLALFKRHPNYSFWQNLSYQSCSALFQSCHNDFISFLYAKGQYSIVSRGCSIASLLTFSSPQEGFSSHIFRCHESTMVAISQFQSHLSDVDTYRSLESDELTPELCQSVETLLTIPIIPSTATQTDRPLSILTITAEDDGDKNYLLTQIQSWLTFQQNKVAAAPIADALCRLSERSSFRILYYSISRTHLDSHHPVDTLVNLFPLLFFKLYELCHRSNSLTLLDRARAVLPSTRSGDELTLAAAKETIDVLTRLSHDLKTDASSCAMAIQREIELEIVAVWSNIFNLALHCQQLDRALEAVTTLRTLSSVSSDPLHWRSCLRTLIYHACTTGNIVWLCSLPDALFGPDGVTYIDLTKEITIEMENLARSSDLMSLPSTSSTSQTESGSTSKESITSLANFYDCISSFLICKKQYLDCARLQYQLVERLGGGDELSTPSLIRLKLQHRCLSIAISSLWCIPINQRYVIHEQRQKPSPSLREGVKSKSFTATPTDRECLKSYLSLKEIEHRYLQVQSKLSLGLRSQNNELSSDLELVRALCEEGNFIDALNLAIHPQLPSNQTNTPLSAVISSFSSQCTALSLQTNAPTATSSILSLEEQFISSLGSVPHPLISINQTADQYLWQYFTHVLHLLDNPQEGLFLHQIGTKSSLSLSLHRDKRIPDILCASFSGLDDFYSDTIEAPTAGAAASSNITNIKKRNRGVSGFSQSDVDSAKKTPKRRRGNIDSLIRTLLSQGCLIDACKIVSQYFSQENRQILFNSPTQQSLLPISAIDQLLFACQTALQLSSTTSATSATSSTDNKNNGNDADQEAVDLLKEHYEQVQKEISNYFVELFQKELVTK